MNFLPLVITFLLIFAAVSSSFLLNFQSDKSEAEAYTGSLRAIRNLQNSYEENHFDEIAAKDSSLKEELSDDEQLPSIYFRELWFESPKGKVNLYHLLKNQPTAKHLQRVLCQYIQDTYGHMYSIDPDLKNSFALHILNGIIEDQNKHFKEKKAFKKLEDVKFKDKELQIIYIKMLSGTNTYDLKKSKGYPSFLTLFSFVENESKPIKFQFANTLLLRAVFGEKIATAIEEQEFEYQKKNPEKERDFALTENSLRELISSNYEKLPKVFEMIDFSPYQKKQQPPNFYTDTNTNITKREPMQKRNSDS